MMRRLKRYNPRLIPMVVDINSSSFAGVVIASQADVRLQLPCTQFRTRVERGNDVYACYEALALSCNSLSDAGVSSNNGNVEESSFPLIL